MSQSGDIKLIHDIDTIGDFKAESRQLCGMWNASV